VLSPLVLPAPAPPPAEVIVENTELEPLAAKVDGTPALSFPAPPPPTVIG
jgi:hypothetical protein